MHPSHRLNQCDQITKKTLMIYFLAYCSSFCNSDHLLLRLLFFVTMMNVHGFFLANLFSTRLFPEAGDMAALIEAHFQLVNLSTNLSH